ncbi:MAG TPA: DNA primase [Myxococcota bacterium]|nr:DNA primase [Myxococcota bacterium]HQK51211.1 DNA primase [Myxococcota bacterium]
MLRSPGPNVKEILERVHLLEVVQEYVSLKKRGRTWWGLCPFHSEKTPSFSVNPEKGVYYCFGCHAGGNAMTFLMEVQGLSRSEAIVSLARRAGITLSEEALRDPREDARSRERADLVHVIQVAQQFFTEALRSPEGEEARRYLEARGIPPEVTERFGLGFGGRPGALADWLGRHGIPLELAEAGGLLTRSPGGAYERFRERLVCPVRNLEGVPIAFSARLIRPDPDAPKYVNSPESPIYVKGESVFGLHQARMPIRQKHRAVLVEGNFDVLSLVSAGVQNVVAPLGTALTVPQLRLVRRFADTVVLFFDGDEAGRKATERAIPLLLAEGVEGFVVATPAGEDPDTLVRKVGGAGIEALVDQARPMVSWWFRGLTTRFGATPHGKRKVIESAREVLSAEQDPFRHRRYLEELAQALEVDVREVVRMVRAPARASDHPGQGDTCPGVERRFLTLVALCPDLLAQMLASSADPVRSLLGSPAARQVFQVLVKASLEGEDPADVLVRSATDGGPLVQQISRDVSSSARPADPDQEFREIVALLQVAALEREARDVEARIRLAGESGRLEEVATLQKQHLDLWRQVMELRRSLQTAPSKGPLAGGAGPPSVAGTG